MKEKETDTDIKKEPSDAAPTPNKDNVTQKQEQQAEVTREQPHAEEHQVSLADIIREQATEEDAPINKANLSLRKVLGGDILMAEIVRKQIWLVLLISLFVIVYIALGYSYKRYILDIDKLQSQLVDAKYEALSSRSDLTEHTRESKILELLRIKNDTTLHVSDRPPFIIEVPED